MAINGKWYNFLVAFSLTLLAGLSTGIGAVIAFFFKGKNTLPLSIGLGFSGGVMIYVSFMDLLPIAFGEFGEHGPAMAQGMGIFFFFAGIGLAALIDRFVPEDVNPHELKNRSQLTELSHEHPSSLLYLQRTGIFTALAIGIHNFPEGFATFISALSDPMLGVPIALAIAIHNIPEGMAVSLPIYHATGDRKRAFSYSFLSGLAEPVGALAGFFLLAPFMGPEVMGAVFAGVAGIMVYISFDELLPAARVYGNSHSTIFGITAGMFVMAASLVAFEVYG